MMTAQLLVMALRMIQDIFVDQYTEVQAIILMGGEVAIKATLYFFVFEMKIIAEKLICSSHFEYLKRARRTLIEKYIIMGLLLFVYFPSVSTSFLISTTISENREKY